MTSEAEQYKALVEKLYKRTKEKDLPWGVTWTGEVVCDFRSYKLRLGSSEGPEGSPLETIEILNAADQVIDSFNDEDLPEGPPDLPFPSYWRLMQAIHKAAKRQALGADVAIRSIIENLDADDL